MRSVLSIPLVVLSLVACSEPPTQPELSADAPSFARGASPKATGGAYAAALDLYLTFNAQGTPTSAKGQVNYRHAATGRSFAGEVACYHQVGNRAGFSGEITRSNISRDYFLVEVIDNGEGDTATGPDRFRVLVANVPYDCTALSGAYPAVVTDGNIQVH